MPEHIDAKAIDTFPKPETHDIVDRLTHCRIAPVQIGLLGEEGVIVILLCAGVVLPSAAAKFRHPVGQHRQHAARARDTSHAFDYRVSFDFR